MQTPLILVSERTQEETRGEIDSGRRPRIDYLQLAGKLGAEILDYSVYEESRLKSLFRPLEKALRIDLGQAVEGAKKAYRYRGFYSTSERVGIPLAMLLRKKRPRKPHIMLGDYLLSPKKRQLFKLSGLLHSVDKIVCLTSIDARSYQSYFQLSPRQVQMVHYGVDQEFFNPIPTENRKHILSLGTSKRDYATLMRVMNAIEVPLKVKGTSSWYARDPLPGVGIPRNVEILGWCSFAELRDLYAESFFVVVPIKQTFEHTAGITSVLEAAAMARAVVATRTPGMVDYVKDGETGILVEPYDVDGMREAIQYLLDNPHEAERMGRNGRQLVEREMNVDVYVEKLTQIVEEVMQEAQRPKECDENQSSASHPSSSISPR